jgi:TolA-binding protein
LLPGGGVRRGIMAIWSCAILGSTDLQVAARAGALCAVVKGTDRHERRWGSVSDSSGLGEIQNTQETQHPQETQSPQETEEIQRIQEKLQIAKKQEKREVQEPTEKEEEQTVRGQDNKSRNNTRGDLEAATSEMEDEAQDDLRPRKGTFRSD